MAARTRLLLACVLAGLVGVGPGPAVAVPLHESQAPAVSDLFALAHWDSSAVPSTDCASLPSLAPSPATFSISCDAQGYILSLNMSNLGLQGPLPHSLRSLVSLHTLDVQQNGLEGPIPGQVLGSLQSLRYLNLRRNLLTSSVPEELGTLGSLSTLLLSYNQLSGPLPPFLGSLSSLATLVLRRNLLSGSIPGAWSTLTSLTALDLGYNQLSGSIPDTLSALSALQILSLGSNHLEGAIPSWIGGSWSGLKLLDLSANQFSGSIPASLGQPADLVAVSLDNNQLQGSLPATLGALHNLQFFYALGNKLSGTIPPSWSGLTSLRAIDLSNNPELGNGTSFPQWIDSLTLLNSIRLQSCSFQGVLPAGLGRLVLLRELFLHNNYLSGPLPDSVCGLSHLHSLDLSGNALRGPIPPCLLLLPPLSLLSLENNLFTGALPTSSNPSLDFRYGGNCLAAPAASQRLASSPDCAPTPSALAQPPVTPLHSPDPPGAATAAPPRPSILQIRGPDEQFPQFLFGTPEGEGAGASSSPPSTGGLSLTKSSSAIIQEAAGSPPDLQPQSTLLSSTVGPEGPSTGNDAWYSGLKIALIISVVAVVVVLMCAIVAVFIGTNRAPTWPCVAAAAPYSEQLPVTEYGLSKIKKATKNFSTLLGKGSFGHTFLAEDFFRDLPETRALVKRATDPASLGEVEFRSKVEELGRGRHPCCVSLLGYCVGKGERILIFEYLPNGTLYDRLHQSEVDPLPWEARVRIAVNVACALEFLHSATAPLVHRAVTSSNILLTQDMSAKLSDYGLARGGGRGMENAPKRRRPTRIARGQAGAAAADAASGGSSHGAGSSSGGGDVESGSGQGSKGGPEKEQQLVEKVDVYGFGVVLLELITGQKAMKDVHITSLAAPFLEDPQMMPLMVDAALGGYFNQKELVLLGSIARDCVKEDPSQRPSMRDVLAQMESELSIDLQLYHSMGDATDLASLQGGVPAPGARGGGYSVLQDPAGGYVMSAVSSAASSFRSLLGGGPTSSAPPTPGGSSKGPGSDSGDTDSTTSSTLLFITPKK